MGAKAPAVLIVDDNTEFANLLGTLVAEQGLSPILAHTAANALTLAKLYAPQAMVIDLLLPDMTGHKLIKELSKPQGPPVFVITGVFKGQSQMEKVKSVANIAGWFEKPFDTRTLVEQVVRAVGKKVVQRVQHHKAGEVTADFDINILDPLDQASDDIEDIDIAVEDDVELDIDVSEEGDDGALALWNVVESATPLHGVKSADLSPGVTLEMSVDEVFDGIPLDEAPMRTGDTHPVLDVDQTPPVPIQWPAGTPFDPRDTHDETHDTTKIDPGPFESVTNPFAQKLVSGFGKDLSPLPQIAKAGLRAKMRSGELKPATVARLLTTFYVSKETGEIALERGTERKVIYFSEGRPVYARSNQDSDRIGAIAKKAFGLTQAQIDSALAIARKTDRMIGEVLIDQGMIEQSRRPDLVREQTRAIIKSLFTWTEGRYVIGFNTTGEIVRAELEDHPASLVVLAIRDQFDVDRLRALVPDKMSPMPSPNPPYELHELPMGDAEALLLLRATGARNVAALLGELGPRLDEHDARAFIYALLLLGILVAGRGGGPKSANTVPVLSA